MKAKQNSSAIRVAARHVSAMLDPRNAGPLERALSAGKQAAGQHERPGPNASAEEKAEWIRAGQARAARRAAHPAHAMRDEADVAGEVSQRPVLCLLDDIVAAVGKAHAVNLSLASYVVHQEAFEPDPNVCAYLTDIVERELSEALALVEGVSEQLAMAEVAA